MLARSPNRNAAVAYLAACGATPITIVDRDGVGVIIVGKTASGIVAARWWLPSQDAQRVAGAARRLVGAGADVAAAVAAVMRSASTVGATLTPDETAIRRAADALIRLDVMISRMKRDGTLHQFNVRYKAERAAAQTQGRGFMSYTAATARLKLALVPGLQSGKPIVGLFADVFG
jgi:hypothetical protein